MTLTQLAEMTLTQLATQITTGTKPVPDLDAIPPALDQTKGMTKEQIDASRDAAIKNANRGKRSAKLKPTTAVKADNLTDHDKAVIKALKKEETVKKAKATKERLAKLKASKPAKAPKSVKLADLGKTEQGKKNAESWDAIPAVKKARAKPQPKAPARPKGKSDVRPGSKLELIVGLLKRPEGCTTAEVLKATGWPAVSMPQQARAAGLTLKKVKDGSVTRYRAA